MVFKDTCHIKLLNKNVDIYDTCQALPSSGTIKIKRLNSKDNL